MSGRQILAVLVMAGGGAIAGLVFVGVMALVQSLRGDVPSPTAAAVATPTPRSEDSKTATVPPAETGLARPTAAQAPTPNAEATSLPRASIPPDLLPPLNDLDNDGLTDDEEDTAGTDRWSWDTDGGGESDGAEMAAGRRPLDRTDDVVDPGCIPPDAQRFEDGVSSDEMVPVPALEAVIPRDVAGHRVEVSSTAGLPRYFGFFNYFWDGLVLCAGAQPADLAHAMGTVLLDSSNEGFGSATLYVVFAIRIDGLSGHELAQRHVSEMVRQGRGAIIAAPRTFDGRAYVLLSRGGAVHHAADVMFWMVPMTFLDSGFYVGDLVDIDLVEATLAQLPR